MKCISFIDKKEKGDLVRATDILTILSVDMQNNVMYDFKIELNDQLFGVGRIEKEQNKLVLYAAESITIEANQLLTTFMLNKSLNLYKFGDKLEPIYGCRVVGSSLVL